LLNGRDKENITLNISSLGGSVDHALAMHDMIAEHGKVTANLTGFVASAATLISTGAAHRRMSKYAFYLIHKAMKWIDTFDALNEDDIEALIARLEKEKDELSKITLQLAMLYSDHTGKSVKEILALMKEEKWLSAEEAKEWGFIDEVYTPGKEETHQNQVSIAAMINANGLPAPPNMPTKNNDQANEDFDSVFQKMKAWLSNHLNSNNNQNPDEMEKIQELEARIAELETRNTELETRNPELETRATDLETRNQELETRNSELETRNQELETRATEIETRNQELETRATELETQNSELETKLANRPGTKPINVNTTKDPDASTDDGVDWETLNNLPHMKDA
jgi:ATP-dependent Clp protease protease subunit